MFEAADYRITKYRSDLRSTAYIEIGPGKYSGKHWQEGFLFISEDAFGMAEGIVAKHHPEYDHFSVNEIPSAVARQIANEWNEVGATLPEMTEHQAYDALNLSRAFSKRLESEVARRRYEIAVMLKALAVEVEAFCLEDEWLSILGM